MEHIQTWPQAVAVIGVAVDAAAAVIAFFWSMTK